MAYRAILVAICGWLALVSVALAQTPDPKALITELGQRAKALESILTLERHAARIYYVESNALLSGHADWPEELHNWPDGTATPKAYYDVKNLYGRFQPELVGLKRVAGRKGIFTDDEKQRMLELIADLGVMVDGTQQLYDLLEDGDLEAATTLFRDEFRPPYESIVQGAYTVGSGVSKDISRLALMARRLE